MDHKAVENAWAKMPFASSLSSKVNTAMVHTLSAVGNPVSKPYTTINRAVIHLDDAGSIQFSPGITSGPVVITKPVNLYAESGAVQIGAE